jgi:hypothetical protein
MEARYLKLAPEKAFYFKKALLSMQADALKATEKVRSYRTLRKSETANRVKLKSSLSLIRTKMSLVQSTFPEEKKKLPKVVKPKIVKPKPEDEKKKATKKRKTNLQKQLDEIRTKLDLLR